MWSKKALQFASVTKLAYNHKAPWSSVSDVGDGRLTRSFHFEKNSSGIQKRSIWRQQHCFVPMRTECLLYCHASMERYIVQNNGAVCHLSLAQTDK